VAISTSEHLASARHRIGGRGEPDMLDAELGNLDCAQFSAPLRRKVDDAANPCMASKQVRWKQLCRYDSSMEDRNVGAIG
jgi:hypothetical protein